MEMVTAFSLHACHAWPISLPSGWLLVTQFLVNRRDIMREALRIQLAVAALTLVVPCAAQAQRGGQVQLPEGPGKDVVQARCVSCHGLNQITGAAGYNQEGWKHVIDSMMTLP